MLNTNTASSVSETQAWEALRAAQLHEHLAAMASSAKLCAQDAESLFNKGDFAAAHRRAIKSLAYSVGIAHPLYFKHAG